MESTTATDRCTKCGTPLGPNDIGYLHQDQVYCTRCHAASATPWHAAPPNFKGIRRAVGSAKMFFARHNRIIGLSALTVVTIAVIGHYLLGPPTPSLAKLQQFAPRLMLAIDAEQADFDKMVGRVEHDLAMKRSRHVQLLAIDLKRTDSILNPIVGEVVFSVSTSEASENEILPRISTSYQYTMTFGYHEGRWHAIKVVRTCEGVETVLGQYYFAKCVEAAQSK